MAHQTGEIIAPDRTEGKAAIDERRHAGSLDSPRHR